MNDKAAYIDGSAFIKLIVSERESRALLGFLAHWPVCTSSALTRPEVDRTLRSSGCDDRLPAALTLGGDLRVLLTYDARLAAAAREHGVRVESPE